MPESVAPLALVAVMAVLHAGYFLLLRRTRSQQSIRLDAFPAQSGPPRRPVEALFDRAGFRSPAAAEDAVRVSGDMEIDAGLLRRPVICGGDMSVTGKGVFSRAVKIEGDLDVGGWAMFDEPVIVNGTVRITGEALFRAGLMVKGALHVEGFVTVGSTASRSWLVAKRTHITGDLWVNGRAEAANASANTQQRLGA